MSSPTEAKDRKMYPALNYRVEEEFKVSHSGPRNHDRPDLYSTRNSSSASSSPSTTRSEIFDIESPIADPPSSPMTPPDETESPFNASFLSRQSAKPEDYRIYSQAKQAIPIRERQNTSDSSPKHRPRGRPRKIRAPSESKSTDASAKEKPSLMLDHPPNKKANPNSQDHPATTTRTSVEPHVPRLSTPRQVSNEKEVSAIAELGETPQFTPYKAGKWTSTRSVNSGIYEYLRKKQAIPREKEKVGYIYLLQSEEHIKIGKTCRDPARRREEWEKCKITLVEIEDTYMNAFRHHGIVEALLLREFIGQRKQYTCASPCGKTHVEWVEVEKDVILRSLNRWRNWIMIQQPFDRDWNLTPYWSWAVRRVKNQLHDVDWEQWTKPGIVDSFLFERDQFDERYRGGLVHHFKRKDLHFLLVGSIILFMTLYFSGIFAAALVILGLLVI